MTNVTNDAAVEAMGPGLHEAMGHSTYNFANLQIWISETTHAPRLTLLVEACSLLPSPYNHVPASLECCCGIMPASWLSRSGNAG